MTEGFGKLGNLEKLKRMLSNREEWMGTELGLAMNLFKTLRQMFDETVSKLINELGQEIGILESVGNDMSKENADLKTAEQTFDKINNKIMDTLANYDEGLIKSAYQIDFAILEEALKVIGEVNSIRSDVDRWARREIRTYDMVIEAVDKELKERGAT